MSRPQKKRTVSFNPEVTLFIPSGVPRCRMGTVTFKTDEIEALRLTDLEGMYQGQAAEVMGISRQTLGNILCGARRKVSDALTTGKAMRISSENTREDCHSSLADSGDFARKSEAGCNQPAVGVCRRRSASECGGKPGEGCGHGSGNGCVN